MKKLQLGITILALLFTFANNVTAQRGYYDAPYKRYEADRAALYFGATVTPKSYSQPDLQSEASDQICVFMGNAQSAVEWTITEAADGLVVRYSVPMGTQAIVGVYVNGTKVGDLTLTSNWSWEHLWNNGNPNNAGVVNKNYRKRFDEVRMKLPAQIPVNGTLKLVTESGTPYIDFAELEPIPAAVTAPQGSVAYIGNGNDLQSFINSNGGKIIYIPAGVYNVPTELYFGVSGTSLQGAGMWYTQLNFTSTGNGMGGLCGNATNVSFSDLYLTTVCASRSNSYKGLNGVFTSGSVIKNLWIEHFECGAWIGQYNSGGPTNANGFNMNNCRFRDNYADGSNLCMGTVNTVVEHCNYRNNGDDDMGIWSANNMSCQNNTFRYNTAENSWRASSIAIYGGKSNKAYNIIIKDNLEVGIRLNNSFAGAPFDSTGMHEIHDVTMIACGTFNDLFNQKVGAIDIFSSNQAGTKVQNVAISNIDVIDSKNDAVYLAKNSGNGIYNLSFQNINVNRTGTEYPYNNAYNNTSKRGFDVLFAGSPAGNITYCGMSYINRGGNATANIDSIFKGTLSWSAVTGCVVYPVTSISVINPTKTIAIGETFIDSMVIVPDSATNKTVTYSVVSGGTSASVNKTSGLVTGLAAGTAVIRVTTTYGSQTADCTVTVQNVSVTGIQIDTIAKTIGVSQTCNIITNVLPTNASNKNITYSVVTGDTYASVDANGVVTGLAIGTATIRSTTVDGGQTVDCTITVIPTISINASENSTQSQTIGTFTISTTATNYDIVVNYTVSGTTGSNDYNATPTLSGSVTLTQSSPSQTITIEPGSNNHFEGSEVLILTLAQGSNYVLGTNTARISLLGTAQPACQGPAIVYTTTNPVIDQTIDSVWVAAPMDSIATAAIGVRPAGYSAVWRSLYTTTDLYFLVQVTKNGPIYNQNGTSWWNDDAVEIYIDTNNSRTTSYNGINDFQYGFRINDGNAIHVGSNPTNSAAGITYNFYQTAIGYNLEVSIPWTTLKTTPILNNEIGLDVAIDVSSGSARETQMTTFNKTGMAYSNPSLFGSVSLTACNPADAVTPINATSNISIISFGNIVKVSGLSGGEIISVYNILGAKIYSLKAREEIQYISSLKEGLYTVSVDGTGKTEKVLIVK